MTTLESTSALLWEQFHTIPRSTLQAHIILRFNMFDLDNRCSRPACGRDSELIIMTLYTRVGIGAGLVHAEFCATAS